MKRLIKTLILLISGGCIYYGLELLFRGRSHPAMILVGSLCFLVIGALNEGYLMWDIPLLVQAIIGAEVTTAIEFVSGVLLNIVLRLDIWDYSNMPLNLFGQICLPFFILWIFVSGVAVVLDDWLRYWLFHEEKPHYIILFGKPK